jgi:hypothetical protein
MFHFLICAVYMGCIVIVKIKISKLTGLHALSPEYESVIEGMSSACRRVYLYV